VNKLLSAVHRNFEQVTILALDQEEKLVSETKRRTRCYKELAIGLGQVCFSVTANRVVTLSLFMADSVVK
jgi:hypothetical protein